MFVASRRCQASQLAGSTHTHTHTARSATAAAAAVVAWDGGEVLRCGARITFLFLLLPNNCYCIRVRGGRGETPFQKAQHNNRRTTHKRYDFMCDRRKCANGHSDKNTSMGQCTFRLKTQLAQTKRKHSVHVLLPSNSSNTI